MGQRVQAQAGASVADVYDVVGSVAGVDELELRAIQGVHEMGSTIFSERLGMATNRSAAAGLAQDTNFDVEIAPLSSPLPYGRILSVVVFGNAARLSHSCVCIRDEESERDIPIWSFDVAVDGVISVRLEDNGAGAANRTQFRGGMTYLPNLLVGPTQFDRLDRVAWRGRTTGFGAGTVNLIMVFQIAFPLLRGVSSRGLPIPSW